MDMDGDEGGYCVGEVWNGSFWVPELLVGKAHRPYVGSEDIYFFHWERGCSQEHFGS